jgi:hypothetical protein
MVMEGEVAVRFVGNWPFLANFVPASEQKANVYMNG